MENGSGTNRIPQDQETPLQVVQGEHFVYRYAYARSSDTRAANDTGQDYIAFRESEAVFVFALCDGVSQSFYGNLAAGQLGDALVAWLADSLPQTMDTLLIQSALASHLKILTGPATSLVQKLVLPEDIPQMLREVLEQKRAFGSESTFVCGRIDLPGDSFPEGRVVLAWMGDSRLRLWGPGGERSSELGGPFLTDERWSTRRGPVKADPHVSVFALAAGSKRTISYLVAYSDGLGTLDKLGQPPSDQQVNDLIAQANESATSDDISFLEVQVGEAIPIYDVIALPAPRLLKLEAADSRLSLEWVPVSDASQYEIEVEGQNSTQQSHLPTWKSSALPPGKYALRVRAWRGQETGPWSEWREGIMEARPQPSPKPVSAAAVPSVQPTMPRQWPSAQVRRPPIVLIAALGVALLAGGILGILALRHLNGLGEAGQERTATATSVAKPPSPVLTKGTAPAVSTATTPARMKETASATNTKQAYPAAVTGTPHAAPATATSLPSARPTPTSTSAVLAATLTPRAAPTTGTTVLLPTPTQSPTPATATASPTVTR